VKRTEFESIVHVERCWKAEQQRRKEEYQRKLDAAREAERIRKENLSMYSRIEELEVSDDLKFVLHAITERLGMED
jgi:ribosome-binding factor A